MSEKDWLVCNTLKLFGTNTGKEVHNEEKLHLDIWNDTNEFIDVMLLIEAYFKKDAQVMAIVNELNE